MAAGDYKIMRNASNTDALPVAGSDLLLLWDTAVANVGSGITYSAGTFTLGETGNFLVLYSDQWGTTDTTANERTNAKTTITLAGSEIIPGYATGYVRRSGGSQEFINFGAAIINVATTTGNGDDLQIRTERIDNSTAGTVNRIADRSGITIIKLDDSWNYGRYTGTTTTTSGTDNVAVTVDLSTTDEQESPFTRTSNTIDIATTNLVLAIYSIKGEDATPNGNRTEYQARLTLAASVVPGSYSQTYGPRTTDNCDWFGMSGMCLLEPSSGDDLELEIVTRDNGGNTCEGTLQLVELPAGAEACIVEATTGSFNTADTNFAWDTNPRPETGAFTHTAGQANIDVDNAGDYLVMASQATTSQEAATRAVPALSFEVNTTNDETTGNSSYHRNSGTSEWAALNCGTLLTGLIANDSIYALNDRIGTVTTTINNNVGGMSVIRLDSLFSDSHTAAPSEDVLVLTGAAPARGSGLRLTGVDGPTLSIDPVSGGNTEEPGTGSLVLTGHIPSILVSKDEKPGDGSLTLTGAAPTVSTTANIWIDVDAGSLSLTGVVPVVVVSLSAYPSLGAVALTGEIPVLVLTANHARAPPIGSVVLTGLVPVTDAGESVIEQPGAGSLTLEGSAPSLARTENHFIDVGVGSLALTGTAPTLSLTANQFVDPSVGTLSLTGYDVTLDYTWVVHPSAGGLTLTGQTPVTDTGQGTTAQPDAGSLTLTGAIPTIARTDNHWVDPGVGSCTLTGAVPTLALTADHFADPGVGSLTLTGLVPTSTTTTDSGNPEPDAATLALTGYIPIASEAATGDVSPGAIELTGFPPYSYGGPGLRLIGYEPYLTLGGNNTKPGAGSATLTGATPTITVNHIVEPASDTLVLTGAAPTATLSGDVTAAINFTSALDITGQVPTIDNTKDVIGWEQPGSLTLTGYDLALSTTEPHSINPGTGSLTLTGYLEYNYGGPGIRLIGYEPTIDNTSTPPEPPISPDSGNLLIETHAPSIEITIDGGFEILILTGYAPTISITTDQEPSPGTGSLTLTGYDPTIQFGTPPNINIPVQAGGLNLTGQAPIYSFSWVVYPGTGSVELTGYDFTLDNLLTIQIPAVPELSITGQAPNAYWGPDKGELTLTGQQPKLTILPNLTAGDPDDLRLVGLQPTLFRRQGGGISKEEHQARLRKREEARKLLEQRNKELVDKIFGDTPPDVKKVLTEGKGDVSGIEVETQPLQPPVYPIEALAPQLEEIKDGLDREIAGLIRAQEEASYQKQLAEFKLKVERFEEELAAFLMLMMMDD